MFECSKNCSFTEIKAKLMEIAAASVDPPNWFAAWASLELLSSYEERLAACQAVRDSGCIPAEAGFFLVDWSLLFVALDRVSEKFRELDVELKSICERYGMDSYTPFEEQPGAYKEALSQQSEIMHEVRAATREAFGEYEMARLYRDDLSQYLERRNAGEQFFQPDTRSDAECQERLGRLVKSVETCFNASVAMGPLGWKAIGRDAVIIYPRAVEIVGGAKDGKIVEVEFRVNLEKLHRVFDSETRLTWEPFKYLDRGPCVSVNGVFEKQSVYVQVLPYTLEGDEGPRLKVYRLKGLPKSQ